MAKNQVEKLIDEAIDTKGTYAEFIVSPGNLAFICDGGLRRSTRNYKVDDKAIIVIERALKRINERSILFTGSLRRIRVLLKDGREAEFVRSDNGNICNVTGKRFTEKNQKEYCWARFTSESDERCGVAFEITRQKNVFCKPFLHKIAKSFCRLLHLHFVGNCKTTAGSYSASHKPLQIIFSCYNTRYGNGSSEFSSSCACSLK